MTASWGLRCNVQDLLLGRGGLSCSKACAILVPRQGTGPTSACNAIGHQESPSVRTTFCDLWADAGLEGGQSRSPWGFCPSGVPSAWATLTAHVGRALRSHITPRITMMWTTAPLESACQWPAQPMIVKPSVLMKPGWARAWYIRGSREMGRGGGPTAWPPDVALQPAVAFCLGNFSWQNTGMAAMEGDHLL